MIEFSRTETRGSCSASTRRKQSTYSPSIDPVATYDEFSHLPPSRSFLAGSLISQQVGLFVFSLIHSSTIFVFFLGGLPAPRHRACRLCNKGTCHGLSTPVKSKFTDCRVLKTHRCWNVASSMLRDRAVRAPLLLVQREILFGIQVKRNFWRLFDVTRSLSSLMGEMI